MEALRLFTESNNHQLIIDLPPGLDHRRLEVIVMPATSAVDDAPVAFRGRRKPSALLSGSVTMVDDLIAPAVSESDWDVLK